MKISQLLETDAGTTSSGSVAPVSQVLSTTQKRTNPSIYKGDKVGSLFKGKQTDKPFANSISEGIEQGVAEGSSEIKIPTEDGITMQDIRLMAGEGKLTRKTVLQAIDIIRKQRKEQGVEESTEQGQKPTTWYKDNKPFSLTRDGSNFHLVDQSGNIVRNLRIPPRYIPMNLEDEGYKMSNTGREYYKNPNWFKLDETSEDELDEKAVSKQQQKFFGMAHAMQQGKKIKGASPELKNVAKTMSKQDVKDFASTKQKSLPKTVEESEINEEDVIMVPGKGHRLNPGLLHKPEVSINPTDTVKVDIPLLIRLLEYAREDATGDLDLHDLAEKLVALSDRGRTLTMRDYERLADSMPSATEVDESAGDTVAKTWDQMTSKEKISGVKGRTVWNDKTRKYYTVFDIPTGAQVEKSDSAIMSGLTK